MDLLILTPVQADQVRGPSADGTAALEPRVLLNGDFILPARVLDDPAHSEHYALLSTLPIADSSEVEFPPVEEEV